MKEKFNNIKNKNIKHKKGIKIKPFNTFKDALNEEDLIILLNIQKNYNKHRRYKQAKKKKADIKKG